MAQPPGATMAVTGKQVSMRRERSKDECDEMLTIVGMARVPISQKWL